MISSSFLALVFLCLMPHAHFPLASAFQSSNHNSFPSASRASRKTRETELALSPEIIHDSVLLPVSLLSPAATTTTSLLLSSSDGESWRQYVPLVVSVAVIADILLGSPVANLALGPMRRASEEGATGDGGESGGSPFSAFGGTPESGGGARERVDSAAIAQAALDKAMNTLELKRFLEENKTEEQRYEDVRKKIDRQMQELDDE